jgi:hypothetical protein
MKASNASVGTKKAGSGLAGLGLAVQVGRPLLEFDRVTLANQPIQLTKDPSPRPLSQPRHGRLQSWNGPGTVE